MSLGIIIPWRESPDRIKPLEAVLSWYKDNFPDTPIYFCDRPGDQWNASASRNDGVRLAQENGHTVIVINDADTIPEKQSLLNAIQAAQNDLMIHNPYTLCRYLDDNLTQRYLAGKIELRNIGSGTDVRDLDWVCGGIYVLQPQVWWDLGGMDEKIVHGPEDLCMERVHRVVKGHKFIKHSGVIYCLSHILRQKVTKWDKRQEVYNLELHGIYMQENDPERILELVKRPPPVSPHSYKV